MTITTTRKTETCFSRCVSQHPSFRDELAPVSRAVLGVALVPDESFSLEERNRRDSARKAEEVKRIPKPFARRQVSFTSLEIREYPVVPGDHPSCEGGCPIALGWDYHNASEHSVDQYEAIRTPRRPRDQLRLSVQEREMLLSANNCPVGEVRRAARRHHRSKSCEGRYCHRKMQSFFQSPEISCEK